MLLGKLEHVLSHIVRLGWPRVSASHRKQRCKRQNDENYGAHAVDLLHKHRVNSLSVCCSRIPPSQWSPAKLCEPLYRSKSGPPTRSHRSALKRSPQCLLVCL